MAKIRVTKEFGFEMAHALWNYDGPCKNIHGHSYKLSITVMGTPSENDKSPKLGMIIDFGDLKNIVNKIIIDRFDHCVVVNAKAPHHLLSNIEQMFEKYEVLPYQPTCENLISDFAAMIQPALPGEVILHSIRLAETSSSFAEWYACDNG